MTIDMDMTLKTEIAYLFANYFPKKSIDDFFTEIGAHPYWWHGPSRYGGGERRRRVFGWIEAVEQSAGPNKQQIYKKLIANLLKMRHIPDARKARFRQLLEDQAKSTGEFILASLHPRVKKLARSLFRTGHYREVIFNAYTDLIKAVKSKSGVQRLDGTPLMQRVFSTKDPILRISDRQEGAMWLFSGAVMGVRNVFAHGLGDEPSKAEALEWLAFASALFRLLEDSRLTSTASQ